MAISSRPDGGFHDIGEPLVDDVRGGAIDPSVLVVGDRVLLLYKREGNAISRPSIIYGQQLSGDGLSLAGPRVRLLESRRKGWEDGVVEAPTAVRLGRRTYLIYSGGIFSTPGYAEGEAVRDGDPLGRYRRVSSSPILHGHRRWAGTGGGSIVRDGSELLLAYNGFPPRERTPRRVLLIRRLALVKGILRPVGRLTWIHLRRYLH